MCRGEVTRCEVHGASSVSAAAALISNSLWSWSHGVCVASRRLLFAGGVRSLGGAHLKAPLQAVPVGLLSPLLRLQLKEHLGPTLQPEREHHVHEAPVLAHRLVDVELAVETRDHERPRRDQPWRHALGREPKPQRSERAGPAERVRRARAWSVRCTDCTDCGRRLSLLVGVGRLARLHGEPHGDQDGSLRRRRERESDAHERAH
eukprot:4454667-Prymnesium_polylepis.2